MKQTLYFNKQQRNAIYVKARDILLKKSKDSNLAARGLCISLETAIIALKYANCIWSITDLLPEFAAFEPIVKYSQKLGGPTYFWWPYGEIAPRIECLDKCINLTYGE